MEFHPENWVRNLFKTVSVVILLLILTAGAVGLLIFYNLTKELPKVSTLRQMQFTRTSEVFSDDNRKIGEFTTERRYPVRFEEIPKHVIYAFLAAEDSRFFEHDGIDFTGILRAVLSNFIRGRYAQGASTITQQVARGMLLATRKKELTRKIREMVLARRMEKELSKNEILHLYLSGIYLGHGAFGIGAAAQNYFHKNVSELTLAEASLLAGLPQRPNDWDPFHNPALAKRRQQYVLRRMVDEKFVGASEAQNALKEPLRLYKLEDLNATVSPYFTEYVRQYLMGKYGGERVLNEGFKVYTTVRYDFQKAAERSVEKGLRDVDKRLGWRGVQTRVEGADKVEALLASVHEEVLDEVTPVRILNPAVDPKAKKMDYDLALFQEKDTDYFGPTPVKTGKYYKALVTDVDDARGAVVKIGRTVAALPFNGLAWVKIEKNPVKKISQVLHVGDVVEVRVDKIDRRANLIVASLEQEPEIQGALLSYEIQTGMVRAMIGGTNFMTSKFNIALQAKRQVGSTFKPILYAAALDKGYSPSSIVSDSPIVFKFDGSLDADMTGEPWRPSNYGDKFSGDIPLRLALIRSMNIPTVKLLDQITVDYGIQYARNLGITAVLPRDLTIALGSWSSSLEEVTRAYAVFPRLGRPVQLVYIKKVLDGSGKVLEEYSPNAPIVAHKAPVSPAAPAASGVQEIVPDASGNVISPQTAYVITDMLKGVVREGTGTMAAAVPASVAGKTGTSNNHRDAWFIGYTPFIMSGVWVGYEKDRPLDPYETGGHAAAPIWVDYMQNVVKNYPKNDFPIPDDIVFAYIDRETGRLASSNTAKRVRVAFKVGSVPNAAGDNLPRIGEPGMRSMSTTNVVRPNEPAAATGETSAPKQDETDDFIRQGYQN